MKINRKYAIRKLAVGVASVSIGLFIANSVDADSFNVVKAVDSGYNRTESGQVDSSGGVRTLKPSEEVKSVPNGEKNFYSTVAFTTEAGLGSGTLINEDTIVTVAHNFVHLNTKNNPITVENNVKKSGDIHIATLPNGKQVKFSNDDVKYWNREGYVQGFKNDLAVIKLKNKFTGETGATLHNEVTKLSNGDRIHVFGFPKGKLIPILNGTVENVENYGANIMGVAYQGSAPGMSGGGLYNANGELIGVNQNGVEGLRSGGITFSKEQLDWINAIARGENAQPVYLADKPKTDDKEEVHPKHGRLLYTDENVSGMIGKLYEDGTYVMKSDNKDNMNLYNSNGGIDTMLRGLTDKDGQPLSTEEYGAIRNKVKRVEVDGKIVADKLDLGASDNTTELDLTGITLSENADTSPFLAYYADNLNKLTLDPNLSLSKVKKGYRIIDNAPNLKLTNEQVTQLLKDTAFEESDGIFNNVGIERLDLTSFDNSKLNNSGVLFKNLKGLKEIAFGDKFNFDKYVPTGQANSYFNTDLSTVEKVSGTDNGVFLKEWVKSVKDANLPKKEVVYKDGVSIGTLEEVLNKTTFEKGVYTIGKAKTVIPEPKVEYLGRGKDIVRKTTTYTVNSETGIVSESVKEEVNPEVDMHFYFVYSIKDSDTFIPSSPDEVESTGSNYKGKIIKEVEYIPEKGKWFANSTLHSFSDDNSDNKIVGVLKWPWDEKFEYNNDIYKVVGSSVEHIISGPDSNDTERSNYERDSKIWHRYPNSRLFYQPSAPVGDSVFNEDYRKLNDAGLAKDGKVVKAFLYAEPVRGTYTQTFIDEDQAKAHENDEDYNPENYFIKDKYDSGKHKLTEDFVLPKAPQYIQKDNKIYKLSSHDTEPTINKYVDADLSTEYRYKVLHENTTKEDITRVAPKDVYVADESRDRTSENVKTNGTEGITRTITTYKVDNDGNLTEEVTTPEKTEVVNNVIKVGTKPKVEYFIRDDVAIKKTTTYTVNSETGEVTEKVQENTIGRAKDKVKTTPIPSPRVYQKDSERELNMPNKVIQGEEGSSSVNITYTLNKETGELTENQSEPTVKNPTPTIIKVAAKDKIVYSKKGNDIIKTTTTYNVNENNGEITSNSTEEVFKVDGLKDKVVVEDIEIPTVYLKDSNREKGKPNLIIEGELGKKTTTTTYNVNPKTGEVFEEKISTDIKHPKDKRIYVPAKDKIEVETIPYTTTYEKDANRELGKANLIYEGTEGSKTTVIKYKVNEKTGEITEERGRTLIREAQGKRILVPAKDKVEVVNKKDGKIIKKTTVYNVDSNTGKITEDIKEEVIADKGDATTEENLTELKVDLQKDTEGNILNVIKMGETPKDLVGYINTGKTELTKEGYKVYIYQKIETSKGEENPPVVENKDFNGGVNPDNAPVVENLSELKVALIKDTDGNVLDVVEENGKPVEIKDYVFTGKQEVDENGYKVYIYQKVESSKGTENPPVVENKDFVGGVNPDNAPVVEELPELKVAVIKDNEDNILDVIKSEEKPKDIPGYKNTGKTGIDKDGYKTYIYEKVKEDKQPVVEDKKEANLKENNNKEIAKKEELPSTTAIPMLSSVSLLSVLGVRKRKNKK